MNITIELTDPAGAEFQALWKQGWTDLIATGNTEYTAPPPFGGTLDIGFFMRVDGEIAGIRSFHNWMNGTAQSRITYVAEKFRNQGVSQQAWPMVVEALRGMGIKRVLYTVLASADAMRAIAQKRGDRLRSMEFEVKFDG